jgi:translocation and assembly module TamB
LSETSPKVSKNSFLKTALRRGIQGLFLAIVVVLVASLAVGSAPGRRFLAGKIVDALQSTFVGHFSIEISALSLFRGDVIIAHGTAQSPDGHDALVVENVAVNVAPRALLASLMTGDPLAIHGHASVGNATVDARVGGIAAAFAPKNPPVTAPVPAASPVPGAPPARRFFVDAEGVKVAHATITLADGTVIVEDLALTGTVAPEGGRATVDGARVQAALVNRPAFAATAIHVDGELPFAQLARARATLDAAVATVPPAGETTKVIHVSVELVDGAAVRLRAGPLAATLEPWVKLPSGIVDAQLLDGPLSVDATVAPYAGRVHASLGDAGAPEAPMTFDADATVSRGPVGPPVFGGSLRLIVPKRLIVQKKDSGLSARAGAEIRGAFVDLDPSAVALDENREWLDVGKAHVSCMVLGTGEFRPSANIEAIPIPRVEALVHLTGGAATAHVALMDDVSSASARFPATLSLTAAATPTSRILDAELRGAPVTLGPPSPPRRPISALLALAGVVNLHATQNLGTSPAVSADLRGRLHDLRVPGLAAGSVAVDVHSHGTLENVQVSGSVDVSSLTLPAGEGMERVHLALSEVSIRPSDARDTELATAVHVSGTGASVAALDAEATVAVTPATGAVSVRRLAVRGARRGIPVTVGAREVTVDGATISAEDVGITGGFGDVFLSGRRSAGSVVLRGTLKNGDVGAFLALAGGVSVPRAGHGLPPLAGRVDGTFDLRAAESAVHGAVEIHGSELGGALLPASVQHASIDAVVRADGRSFSGTIDGKLPSGTVRVALTDGEAGRGSLLGPAAWMGAGGRLSIDGDVALAPWVPEGRAQGSVHLAGIVSRAADAPEGLSADLRALADHLVLRAEDGTLIYAEREANPASVRVVAAGNPATLRVEAALENQLRASAEGVLTAGEWAAISRGDVSPFTALSERANWSQRSVTAKVQLATTPFETLPAIAGRARELRGTVEALLAMDGPLNAPEVRGTVRLLGAALPAGIAAPPPVDLRLDVLQHGTTGEASLAVRGPWGASQTRYADGKARYEVAFDALLAGRVPTWDADVDVDLRAVPLGIFQPFVVVPLGGTAAGQLHATRVKSHPEGTLTLHAEDVLVGADRVPQVSVRAGIVKGRIKAAVDIQEAADAVGPDTPKITIAASAPMIRKEALVDTLLFDDGFSIALDATRFRLAPLGPLLAPFGRGFDGILTGKLRASGSVAELNAVRVEGGLALRHGAFEPLALGEPLREVGFDIRVENDGGVAVENLAVSAEGGELHGAFRGKLAGLSPVSLEGAIQFPERHPFPLVLDGVAYGDVAGNVQLGLVKNANKYAISVQIPRATVTLPDVSGRSLQPLEADPTVTVLGGAPSSHGRRDVALTPPGPPVPPAKTSLPIALAVKLGDIRVKRGSDLDIHANGDLVVDEGVRGTVAVDRGFVELQGRRFKVDRVAVSFDPSVSPSNPQVDASASYDAADGYKVFAEFRGSVATGHLTLRAEPALTSSEILQLIVFGSKDVAVSQNSGTETSALARAAGLGGGVVTQGLNKVLSQVSPIELQTRIDTTNSQSPRPELTVQISRDVAATVSIRVGLPSPGQAPDRSTIRLEYRLGGHVSLESALGDKGTSTVDLTWERRY